MTDPRLPANFGDADAELADTLDNLDGAENYAAWIFDLIRPYVGERVLEVGAGHGTFTELVLTRASRVVATDVSERCVGVLRDRYGDDDRVEVRSGTLDDLAGTGPYDTALLINVLEHIEDDSTALGQLHDLLKPGGTLVVWVPAFKLLYSEFDRKIGHHRRYRVRDLGPKVTAAGLRLDDIRYVNSVGAVAWLVTARILRRTPTAGTAVRIYDRYFVPVLRRAEGRFKPPFGQSVLAVATRPGP